MEYPYANHLSNEEVDYELVLRGRLEERQKDTQTKLRLLRHLFSADQKEGKNYRSPYKFEQEADVIRHRVSQIELALQEGTSLKLVSRLRHYLLRVRRGEATSENGEKLRQELLKNVSELLQKASAKCPLEGEKIPDSENEFESTDSRKGAGAEAIDEDVVDNLKSSLGTVPKTNKKTNKNIQKSQSEDSERALDKCKPSIN